MTSSCFLPDCLAFLFLSSALSSFKDIEPYLGFSDVDILPWLASSRQYRTNNIKMSPRGNLPGRSAALYWQRARKVSHCSNFKSIIGIIIFTRLCEPLTTPRAIPVSLMFSLFSMCRLQSSALDRLRSSALDRLRSTAINKLKIMYHTVSYLGQRPTSRLTF